MTAIMNPASVNHALKIISFHIQNMMVRRNVVQGLRIASSMLQVTVDALGVFLHIFQQKMAAKNHLVFAILKIVMCIIADIAGVVVALAMEYVRRAKIFADLVA